jgi:AcrR family transcriptional regulator
MENTRETIIRASMRLYTRKGYFNTSMRDISRETGLSTGAIYHHFAGKEEIAKENLRRTVAFLLEELKKSVARAEDVQGKLFSIIHALLRLADENREMMEYALYIKHREIIPQGKPICSSEPFEFLKNFIRHEMEQERIRQMNVFTATVCLTAMPIRFMQLKWDGVIHDELTHYTEGIFESVWRALKV